MLTDFRGLPVTASGDATVEAIDTFVEGFLGYENKAAAIIAAADADVESTLANAYAAMFGMFLERGTGNGGRLHLRVPRPRPGTRQSVSAWCSRRCGPGLWAMSRAQSP